MDDIVTGSANAARPLNVNSDGSPLTYRTATHGVDSADWLKAMSGIASWRPRPAMPSIFISNH